MHPGASKLLQKKQLQSFHKILRRYANSVTEKQKLTKLFGSCLCGSTQFFAQGPPMQITHCHCSICRRASGAAFLTYASFPIKRIHFVRWSELRAFDVAKFCSGCGSTIGMQYPASHPWGEAHTMWLTAALLGPSPSSAPAQKTTEFVAIDTLQWSGESKFPEAHSGLADGPGEPVFSKPTHIFTESRAHWLALGGKQPESVGSPLLRAAGVAAYWSEVDGHEMLAPMHDIGRQIDPVSSPEEEYALRGQASPPLHTKDLKTYNCEMPCWITAEDLSNCKKI
eukprot:gnl/MRDRNA2_/MRDRNA2_62383_c0_seq3.p1 gnl/MRDRNA2_/MRDRNA2_62383_c0~~gnl/MRDRNA2_/MRDRNA2_62383_c0_seq3.p1  ORF type:complete len:282 (+),score=34.35 gnl/MRDRNA2_/MRDRNA2_62383_c0_seq3:52-897(+)